jgi:CRP-like cAMP-binding protein
MELLPRKQHCSTEQLARKLSQHVPLTPNELLILQKIASDIRPVARRRDIIQEGKNKQQVFFVIDGILIRYRILRDGRRQVVNIVIPGDIAGIPGCFFDNALYSVKTLTDSVVAVAPLAQLVGLLTTQPLLAAKIFWSFSCDAAIYAEHLVMVGRRSALERIAHFLLELMTRLQVVGLADGRSFHIPLSQEVIGDALGLSIAYVNRMLRQLADDGMVVIKDHKVVINDVAALSALADFEQGYLKPTPISQYPDPSCAGLAAGGPKKLRPSVPNEEPAPYPL